jgi:hypothetical protein
MKKSLPTCTAGVYRGSHLDVVSGVSGAHHRANASSPHMSTSSNGGTADDRDWQQIL